MRASAAALLVLTVAGCLTEPGSPPGGGTSETGASPEPASTGAYRFLLLENDVTSTPAQRRENAPWCAPASYDTDPPRLVLHTPEDPPTGTRGFVVREYGDGETFQHHDRVLHPIAEGRGLHVPASLDAGVTLVGVRIEGDEVVVFNATTSRELAALTPGESWVGTVRYVTRAPGTHAVREDLRLTYVGDVAPSRNLAPCD